MPKRRSSVIDHHIGSRLRRRRAELGLTMDAVAKLLDISAQQLQKYEVAENCISASQLFELSQTLKIPVSYFYEDLDVPESVNDHGGSLRQSILVSRSFKEIGDSHVRECVAALIGALASAQS